MTLRQQIVARIRDLPADAGRGLVEVAGAADVAAVLEGRISPPSVFVIRSSSNRSDNGHTITLVDQYTVLTAVRNVRDARGDDASDVAEGWSANIEHWLADWTPAPDGQFESLKLLRGHVLRWTDQLLVWSDIYQLTYLRRCCS